METICVWGMFQCVIRFKSYYVVWKLLNGPGKYFEAKGLNRTMQYGNIKKVDTAPGWLSV